MRWQERLWPAGMRFWSAMQPPVADRWNIVRRPSAPGLSGALPRQQTVPHVPGFGFNRFAMAMSASPPAVSACLVLQDWIKIKIRQRLL